MLSQPITLHLDGARNTPASATLEGHLPAVQQGCDYAIEIGVRNSVTGQYIDFTGAALELRARSRHGELLFVVPGEPGKLEGTTDRLRIYIPGALTAAIPQDSPIISGSRCADGRRSAGFVYDIDATLPDGRKFRQATGRGLMLIDV